MNLYKIEYYKSNFTGSELLFELNSIIIESISVISAIELFDEHYIYEIKSIENIGVLTKW